jgi:hypothetical protein
MSYDAYFRKVLERESEAMKVPFRAVRCAESDPKKMIPTIMWIIG